MMYGTAKLFACSGNMHFCPAGGSIENRCRFVLEVVDAVIAEVGPGETHQVLAAWWCMFATCRRGNSGSVCAPVTGQVGNTEYAQGCISFMNQHDSKNGHDRRS